MTAPMHELPPVDLSQSNEIGGPAPFDVGIEGPQFGQDSVALLEAGSNEPGMMSRLGDRAVQVGNYVAEKARDRQTWEYIGTVGKGALEGAGVLMQAEDGGYKVDTGGLVKLGRDIAKNPTPMGVVKALGPKTLEGAYNGLKVAQKNVQDAYGNPH